MIHIKEIKSNTQLLSTFKTHGHRELISENVYLFMHLIVYWH